MAGGRPTKYTKALATEICERIGRGEGVRKISRDDHMPNADTIHNWVLVNDQFAEQYVRARQLQADTFAEECLEIADDGRNDTYEDEEGQGRVNHDHIQRSRLRVDTRKWWAARLAPKKYGDRVMQEVSGPDGGPVKHQITVDAPPQETREQWEKRKALEADKVKIELAPQPLKVT